MKPPHLCPFAALLALALGCSFAGCSCDDAPASPAAAGAAGAAGAGGQAGCPPAKPDCNARPSGLTLAAPGARSCEVVLEVDTYVSGVTFNDGVKGQYFGRGGRVGVAVIKDDDSELQGSVASVQVAGGERPRVVSAACYQRDGQPVDKAQATVE